MLFILLDSFSQRTVCERLCVCAREDVCVYLYALSCFLFGCKIFDEMFCAHFIYAYIYIYPIHIYLTYS